MIYKGRNIVECLEFINQDLNQALSDCTTKLCIENFQKSLPRFSEFSFWLIYTEKLSGVVCLDWNYYYFGI